MTHRPPSSTAATPLLSLRNLSVTFDTDEGLLNAVDDVSLDVHHGETLGIVGESGCGKSVTALSLLRLIPSPPGRITSGSALFKNRDLLALPPQDLRHIRGRDITMIFQEPSSALSPLLRIGDQMIETLQIHSPIPDNAAKETAIEWLHKVGIPDPPARMLAYPYQLSGGMIQRVMIAMALMTHPALVIADEPTTALDVTIQAQILDLLRAMKQRDTALVLITHDLGVVWEMCDRIIVMYASQVVEEASRDDLFHTPCHPYTRGLIDSLVSMSSTSSRLHSIDGQVPSPLNYPAGCRFAPRCPLAFDRCHREQPVPTRLTPGHCSACFLAPDLAKTPSPSRREPAP
jgi:peptide/nickel transport system ATP-binding protein/oligopeptide transport system ATP-binding protein